MSMGYDATASLAPLNYTTSFTNPAQWTMNNNASINQYSQGVLGGILQDTQRSQQHSADLQTAAAMAMPNSAGGAYMFSDYSPGGGSASNYGYGSLFGTGDVAMPTSSYGYGGDIGSGFGGAYRSPSIDWGGVGQAAASLGSGGTGYTPQPNSSLDWSTLFGGGGARADPYPGMSMPGGLNSPMTVPQQQPLDYGSLFGRGVGGSGGTDPYPGMTMPGGLNSPMTTPQQPAADPYPGMTMPGGLASPMTAREPAYDYGSLFGRGAGAPQSSVFDIGASPITGAQDTGPYGGGAGIGGLDTGRAIGAPYTAPAEPQRGLLQEPVTEAYNPYFNVTGGEGAPPRADAGASGASAPGGGLTAADLSEQARAKLAELMAKPKEPSPDEIFAGDKPVPTEGQPGVPDELPGEAGRGGMVGRAAGDEVTDKTSGQEGLDAGERVPLPRDRPTAADTGGGELTARPDRPGATLEGVNKKFAQALKEFAREYHSTQGDYKMELRSGLRTGPDQRLHRTGEAVDITLRSSKTGELLPDYQTRDPQVFKAYQDNANQFHQFLEKNYPDLAAQHRWGGYFWDGGPGHYGSQDIMHHDLGAHIGMAAGSWQGGLGTMSAQAYGLPGGGGLSSAPPRPPADIPYPNGVPLPADRPETAGPRLAEAPPLPAETPATQTYPGADAPRPPADVPDPRVSGAGFNALDAAAPHSGLELARANMDTPIERIAMERGGQKAVDQISFMAMGKTPRELAQSYGSMFFSNAEPLFKSLGITRQDFDKAAAMPQTKQDVKMRFGGDFGGMGGELPSPGAFTPYPGFRQSADFEFHGAEQSGRDQLAQLQAQGTSFEPGPEVASTPIGRELGLEDLGRVDTSNIQRLLGYTPQQWPPEAYPQQPAGAETAAPTPAATEEFTPTRSITERAPSPAAEEMQRRYGGVGNADVGPPQYSGFEQPYGPQYQPGQYMRDQFANHADFTLQDQAERLAGQREHAGAQIAADPELRRNTIATVLAEMGQNQTDAGRLMVIESMLNRLSANENAVNPNYAQGLYKMLGYRNAAGEIDPAGSPIQRSSEGQYYEPFRYGQGGAAPPIIARGYDVMRDHPELAAHVGDLLDAAIKTGTNVSNLATENSSDAMAAAAARTQSPNAWSPIPGSAPELFSRKDLDPRVVPNEHGDPTRYRDWLATLMPPGYQWERQPTSSIPNLPPQWRR